MLPMPETAMARVCGLLGLGTATHRPALFVHCAVNETSPDSPMQGSSRKQVCQRWEGSYELRNWIT